MQPEPDEVEEVEEPEVEETDEPETEETDEVEDTFDDGKFNPDELPEELRPGWKQLQAAFTRKTQMLSEQLKEVEAYRSLGVDAETAGYAVDLYSRINDPSNWPALYQELGQVMEQHGMDIPGRTAEAPAPRTPADGISDDQLDALVEQDPDLAPLVATIKAQRAELAKVDAVQARLDSIEAERVAAQQEAARQEFLAAEAQRIMEAEQALREAFPHYGKDDLDMIYDVAVAHEGDLAQAQERLESYVQSRISAALKSKGRPKKAAATPPAAPAKSPESDSEKTLAEVAAEAEEHMRALHRAGELDLSGF